MTNCADSVRVAHPLFQAESGGSIPTSALQLIIGVIPKEKAYELNRLWHSRVPIMNNWQFCKPCYGALYEGIYYAVALWSQPIRAHLFKAFDGSLCLELRRMAISPDAPRNTASRMLRIMKNDIRKRMPQIIKLLSYQDTAVHEGTIYKASGWVRATAPTPNNPDSRPGRWVQTAAPKIRWECNLAEAEGGRG